MCGHEGEPHSIASGIGATIASQNGIQGDVDPVVEVGT